LETKPRTVSSADVVQTAPPAENGVVVGKVRWYALASLLLLAATLAEFLTGSTKIPQAIANPLGFVMLVGLYGGGALLIREAALRWGRRWGAILLLGGAYAVGEEGFGAKTMTDPLGSNIGNQLYSHWAGINWVPLSALTLFHAAFSIAVPVVLVEMLFPETKGRRLVGNAGVAAAMLAYALVVVLLSLSEPFAAPVQTDLFLAVYAASFILAAYFAPRAFFSAKGERPDRRARVFLILGLAFMGSFFLIFLFGDLLLPWPVTAGLYVPLAALTSWYLARHAGGAGNDGAKLGFVLGMLLVFVPMDVVLEMQGDTGVLLYTALVIALPIIIWRHRRGAAPESPVVTLPDETAVASSTEARRELPPE
jgi:hypothetical protein